MQGAKVQRVLYYHLAAFLVGKAQAPSSVASSNPSAPPPEYDTLGTLVSCLADNAIFTTKELQDEPEIGSIIQQLKIKADKVLAERKKQEALLVEARPAL